MRKLRKLPAALVGSAIALAMPFAALATTVGTDISTAGLTATGNVSFSDAGADSLAFGDANDTVTILGDVSIGDGQWSVSAAGGAMFANATIGGAPVTATLIGQWNSAYAWGNHASAGYALNASIANAGNWDTAYGWGNHASAGYALNASIANAGNWDMAYGWGNHASAGYQAGDADLTALAGVTIGPNSMYYTDGAGTLSATTLTAAGRSILDDADASAQRTTLGLGSLATASTINNGNWSGTDLAIANGGTGASDASTAINSLLPSQSGNSGMYLTTNGSAAAWGNVSVAETDTLADVTGRGATTSTAVSLTGGATIRGITLDTATATDDRLLLGAYVGGAARFDGTLTSADLTAARTWTLPNATGTLALAGANGDITSMSGLTGEINGLDSQDPGTILTLRGGTPGVATPGYVTINFPSGGVTTPDSWSGGSPASLFVADGLEVDGLAFFDSATEIESDAAGAPALNTRAASGQTASIQEWTDNGNSVLAEVDSNGVGNFEGVYGELYSYYGSASVTATTGSTYYQFTDTIAGLDTGSNYADADASSDRITIGTKGAGIYRVTLSAAYSASVSGGTVHVAVFKNGSNVSKLEFDRRIGTSGDVGAGALTGLVSLASGDYLDVRVASSAGSNVITFSHFDLNVERISK